MWLCVKVSLAIAALVLASRISAKATITREAVLYTWAAHLTKSSVYFNTCTVKSINSFRFCIIIRVSKIGPPSAILFDKYTVQILLNPPKLFVRTLWKVTWEITRTVGAGTNMIGQRCRTYWNFGVPVEAGTFLSKLASVLDISKRLWTLK
jgi:hypothetical protein